MRCCKDVKMKVIQALNEAFIRAQSLGKVKLAVNPFFDLHKKVGDNTKDKYKQTVTAMVRCLNGCKYRMLMKTSKNATEEHLQRKNEIP